MELKKYTPPKGHKRLPQSPTEKYLDVVMHEMCKRVGANWDNIDGQANDWYMMYQWTEAEQDDFKKWLVDYLYKTKEAREAILQYPSINTRKKDLIKVADWFILQYGWVTRKS